MNYTVYCIRYNIIHISYRRLHDLDIIININRVKGKIKMHMHFDRHVNKV